MNKKHHKPARLNLTRPKKQPLLDLDLLSFVSHQIKTPLSTLKLNTRFLKKHPLSSQQQKHVQTIDEEINNLMHIAASVLDIKKIKNSQAQLTCKWQPWGKLLQNTLQTKLKTFLKTKKITVQTSGPKAEVYIDGFYMQQALINLIVNAGEHSPLKTKKTVQIKWELKKKALKVSVLDNGPGLKDAKQIFSPFNSQSPRRGLGLFLARQVLQAHGGDIKAKNQPGGGAGFYFTLPHARSRAVQAA